MGGGGGLCLSLTKGSSLRSLCFSVIGLGMSVEMYCSLMERAPPVVIPAVSGGLCVGPEHRCLLEALDSQ